jgi:hypothetical protein
VSKRQWESVDSDYEFTALFVGRTIVQAATSFTGEPYRHADLFWELSDGTWLAMEIDTSPGCETCGYGAGEKSYWVLRP